MKAFEIYEAEAKEKWGNTAAYQQYEEKAKNTNPKVGKMEKAHNVQFKILNYNRESCIEIIPHSSLRIPNYFVSLPFNR